MFQLSKKQKQILLTCEIVSAVFGIVGALTIALNLDISKYGYFIFLIGSLASLGIGYVTKLKSVIILGYVYSIINIIGIVRWFN